MDAYLQQHADPDLEPTRFRALVEVSRRVQAVAACLLAVTGGAWRSVYSVGFSEAGPSRFVFPVRTVLATDVFEGRKLALVNVGVETVAALAARTAPDDLRFMRRAAFVPAVLRGEPAYLFLAFAEERDGTLASLLEGLDIA